MDNQVEEIKKKLDIVDVIGRHITLKKRGRHHLACCPFHSEKTPSFVVSPELQIFKCFGCSKSGDIFTFVQEFNRVDFKEALEDLAKMAGITLVKSAVIDKAQAHHKKLIEINTEVAKFYNYILTSHPLGKTALDYVLKRGLKPETIKLFKIGFSPSNSQLLINYLQKKSFDPRDLIATGTFGASQYQSRRLYDRFSDRLVFPLYDYRERILGFSGRIIDNRPNTGKYINSPETEIYHKSEMLFGLHLTRNAIREKNAVIVTEGEFDMLSPYQIGITNIVALKGTAFTQEQLQLLRRYADTLILALDSDFAGDNAARKSIEMADNLDFDIKVLSLGDKYKDPDEAIRENPEFFKNQLNHLLPVWDFIIESALRTNDPSVVKGKRQILATVLPFLVRIKNQVIKSDYFTKLANEIGSAPEAIKEEALRYKTTPPASTPASVIPIVKPPSSDARLDQLQEFLLILLFGAKKPFLLAKKIKKHLSAISSAMLKPITTSLLTQKNLSLDGFQQSLPAEIRPFFQNLYLQATSTNLDSLSRQKELKKTLNRIDLYQIKGRLDEISRQISRLETFGHDDQIKAAEVEYNNLLQKLSRLQHKV